MTKSHQKSHKLIIAILCSPVRFCVKNALICFFDIIAWMKLWGYLQWQSTTLVKLILQHLLIFFFKHTKGKFVWFYNGGPMSNWLLRFQADWSRQQLQHSFASRLAPSQLSCAVGPQQRQLTTQSEHANLQFVDVVGHCRTKRSSVPTHSMTANAKQL